MKRNPGIALAISLRGVSALEHQEGVVWSIIWLQKRRDEIMDRLRGGASQRKEEQHEVNIGRLRLDRVRVPRGDNVLGWARCVMTAHAERKSQLEVEFMNEEGTGLGPSLEFYALVAAELQRKSLGLWMCDDDLSDRNGELDLGHGTKPVGYYVRRPNGLFIAPWPQSAPELKQVCEHFELLGILLAKCIQDGRRIDLPLASPFFKLMCSPPSECEHGDHDNSGEGLQDRKMNDLESNDVCTKEQCVEASNRDVGNTLSHQEEMTTADSCPWFEGILGATDLAEVDPLRGRFLAQLRLLVEQRDAIQKNTNISEDEKEEQIKNLTLPPEKGHQTGARLEDLCLSFVFEPSSKVFNYRSYNLKPNSLPTELTVHNAHDYIAHTEDFCLNSGIRRQLDAFKAGFDRVFAMEKLQTFSPYELNLLLCGEQVPNWTREDLLNYTEPKYGYNKESDGYLNFVSVVANLGPDERKSFVQFITGCSSLPPGGLANLHPRLTVVRKDLQTPYVYPSVNTCVHYLKLPEYPTAEILRERLLEAMKEKGFHLN